jgi:Uma2 family endonuclease
VRRDGPLHRYTFQDYLALENSSSVRHEFWTGEICAMAGGTPEHAALAIAVVLRYSVRPAAECAAFIAPTCE